MELSIDKVRDDPAAKTKIPNNSALFSVTQSPIKPIDVAGATVTTAPEKELKSNPCRPLPESPSFVSGSDN